MIYDQWMFSVLANKKVVTCDGKSFLFFWLADIITIMVVPDLVGQCK